MDFSPAYTSMVTQVWWHISGINAFLLKQSYDLENKPSLTVGVQQVRQ
jgi:hypothetical protein